MALDDLEAQVVADVAAAEDELVALVSDLIGFDTSGRVNGAPRDEASCQHHLAGWLAALGASTHLWEPTSVAPGRQLPEGADLTGYPQLVARVHGAGGGRDLLLNGHVDVVSAEPRDRWRSDPFVAELHDGRLYGRGACDMKGGIAAMVLAVAVLERRGVRLRGDLVVNTVTDEETTSAGGLASVAEGVRADGGIVPEPTELRLGVACRGSLLPKLTVEGRAGHAGAVQPGWREGGAVNAIEKAVILLDAVGQLETSWAGRPELRDDLLPPGEVVPTSIEGGDWWVTYPASCRVGFHLTYLPGQADADGCGSDVEREFEECIRTAAAADPWLVEHPPTVTWDVDVPPFRLHEDEPIITTLRAAGAAVGVPAAPIGTDYWFDGATFTRRAQTPTVAFGPGSVQEAHSVDEHVEVADLIRCAQTIAVTAMRFCGVARG